LAGTEAATCRVMTSPTTISTIEASSLERVHGGQDSSRKQIGATPRNDDPFAGCRRVVVNALDEGELVCS